MVAAGMMLLFAAAGPDGPWPMVGAIGGAAVGAGGLATLIWSVRDKRRERRDRKGEELAVQLDRNVARTLKAFEELVTVLQSENARLTVDRDRCSAEAARFRQALVKHNIAIPPERK